MKKNGKTFEIKVERLLETTPAKAYSAWLNPKVPGTPWHEGNALILQTRLGGLFYWLINQTAHYGRFTELKRSSRIRHTWMSRYTEGLESTVTVTFKAKGNHTVMTLVHSGLPDNENGKAHIGGWNHYMDGFPKHFAAAPRKK